jgi:hypothetical protein
MSEPPRPKGKIWGFQAWPFICPPKGYKYRGHFGGGTPTFYSATRSSARSFSLLSVRLVTHGRPAEEIPLVTCIISPGWLLSAERLKGGVVAKYVQCLESYQNDGRELSFTVNVSVTFLRL